MRDNYSVLARKRRFEKFLERDREAVYPMKKVKDLETLEKFSLFI
jgi:hypothetical protein